MPNPLARATFVAAAHTLRQLPADGGREVAFAGRSNAGKSSALNALCNHKTLARTSRTPGRTQQLVYFQVAPERYLVDLPGYGYAKVPLDLRAHWEQFIEDYFRTRTALAGLIVVMDIRHPLRDYDRQMLAFAAARGLPAHGLLTKADKLGRGQQTQTLAAVRRELPAEVGVQVFSAETRTGVEQARGVVAGWLGL
ncbi:MAG: YihA family ribosome biogenesis GTP-binding protein [Proteobacteria bacterium]|nr:YihA family ribosome biogenesis GTP-binding protein [Pseudomonadota bacterium]